MGYRNNCASDLPNLDSLLMIITFIIIMGFCLAIHLSDRLEERHSKKWQLLLERQHMGTTLKPYDYELELTNGV
jgi:hypothetical protein